MKSILSFAIVTLMSASAFAQEDKLLVLDTDADGRISVEEAASDPALSAVFAELDANKDGYLSARELAEHLR